MSDMRIENVNVVLMREAESNPNHFEPARYKALKDAILKKGFCQPVLLWELPTPLEDEEVKFEIIDGHHRIRACVELQIPKVPAVIYSNISEAEVTLLRIGMNRLRGELDNGEVARLFMDLRDDGAPIQELMLTGYTSHEIDDLFRLAEPEVQEAMPMPVSDANVPAYDDEIEAQEPSKLFTLEIPFDDKEEFIKARRALKRAAGKGKELKEGLLRLIGAEKSGRKAAEGA